MMTLTRGMLFVLCLALPAYASAIQIHGRVQMLMKDGAKSKAAKVEVFAPQLALSKKTDDRGTFMLDLRTESNFRSGDDLTLEVQKEGWVVHLPVAGIVRIPADPGKQLIEVTLLPKGSKLLWTEARIDQFLAQMVAKSKEQLKADGKLEDTDSALYVKDWANKLGFSPEEARRKIDEWASEVEKNSEDFNKKGRAAFWAKDYAKAQIYFDQAMELHYEHWKEEDERAQRHAVKARAAMDAFVDSAQEAGDAAYNNYDFKGALSRYQRAEKEVSRSGRPMVWAIIKFDLGKTYDELAKGSEGAEISANI